MLTQNEITLPRNFWLSIVSFCLWRALAAALALSLVLIAGVLTCSNAQVRKIPPSRLRAQASMGPQTFSGMITDSNCNARHSKNGGLSSAECTHFCVHKGARYTLVDGEKVFFLNGNAGQLNRAAGQRVEIHGTLNGDTIQVESVLPQ